MELNAWRYFFNIDIQCIFIFHLSPYTTAPIYMVYRILSLRLLNGFILNFFLYLLQFITMQFAATSIYQSSWSCTRQKHKYVCKYMFTWIRQMNAIPTVMQYLFQLFSFVSCSSSRVAFQFRFAIVVFSFSLSLTIFWASSVGQADQLLLPTHTHTQTHTRTLAARVIAKRWANTHELPKLLDTQAVEAARATRAVRAEVSPLNGVSLVASAIFGAKAAHTQSFGYAINLHRSCAPSHTH